MATSPEQQRLTPAERSNLVAYLDGELNEAESRAIATKLTKSATARREIEGLEKTWELLELLPRPKASEDFTARDPHGSPESRDRGREVRVGRQAIGEALRVDRGVGPGVGRDPGDGLRGHAVGLAESHGAAGPRPFDRRAS